MKIFLMLGTSLVSLFLFYLSKYMLGILLILVFLLLIVYSLYRGNTIKSIAEISYLNGKKVVNVVKIFALVGAITSAWILSGTIPGIVYYGLELMNPSYFYVLSFIITCIVSFLLGSSFGTASTVGICLITIARALQVDIDIAIGTIMSGAYFGDRCSPVSSSASLVATLTETKLYTNIKNMIKTSIVPFTLTIILYLMIPFKYSGELTKNPMAIEIENSFNLNILIFIPVIIILLGAGFKINVKLTMITSILTAIFIAVFLQEYSITSTLKMILLGVNLNRGNLIKGILKGGGIISMWRAIVIVYVSCCMSGIINQVKLLDLLDQKIEKIVNRTKIFITTILVATVTAALGCTQSIAVVMTSEIMRKSYKKLGISDEELAIDIENTCITISPMIPWNIASLIPATIMGATSYAYLGYSFYLYLIPLSSLVFYMKKKSV